MAKELGRPARVTFRRTGNRFTVAPAGPGAAAATTGASLLEGGTPSEMSLETNILRYLANCLERRHDLAEGAVVPVSPTQHEERTLGFDAAVGLAPGRYAVLQFKRPAAWTGRGTVPFKIGDRQALTLLRYPRGSAFYVLPPVCTNGEMAGLGRCLLHKARMVDAWDVLPPIILSWRLARAAPGRGGARGGRSAGTGSACTAHVDGGARGGRDAVHIQAGRGRRLPRFCVVSEPVSALCHGAGNAGFDVRDGCIVTRSGAGWDHGKWQAEVNRALKALGERAHRHGDDRRRADEDGGGRGGGADDGQGQPGLEDVESRFLRACGRGGQGEGEGEGEGEDGSAYWVWIANAP